METPNDEIARLDMAARAVISETFISRNRWPFLLINLFLVAAVLASNARFDTPLNAPVFTVCAALATAILWVDWQYKLYVPALFYFATAIGCVFLGKTFDALSDRIYGILMSTMFGLVFWKQAGPFATTNESGWEKERYEVDAWWRVLTATERDKEVIEFSTGSFWTGYRTYRLTSSGHYWAMVRLWKGKACVLADFRIRELSAVTFTTLPTGEKQVTIGNRTMRAVDLSMPSLADPQESTLPKSA
jgi:hypothetical protein